MQNKKRISVRDNVAYTHWEMPDLTGVKRRIAQRLSEFQKEEQKVEEEHLEPIPPTPEELDLQREQARKEAYAAGFAEGSIAGNEEGRALGYQEGEKTGEEAGFQSGYQRGLSQAEQEVDQQLARLQSLIVQLQGPLAALDQDVESALLSLVDLVCRAILRREVKLERSFLAEVLQEAVAALPAGHQRLRIFLNPEDLNLAEAACNDLLEEYRLVGDPEVTLGGAKIETLQSLVDATLENRYKKIIDKLLGSAYEPSLGDFLPLPDDVLSTPDASPLDEAEFSEPSLLTQPQSLPEPEPEPEPESEATEEIEEAVDAAIEESIVEPSLPEQPVAQVSLQRGKAPRHEQPLQPENNELDVEEFNEENFSDLLEIDDLADLGDYEPKANVADLAHEDQEEKPLEEELLFAEASNVPSDEATAANSLAEPQENTVEVDDFLEEFAEEEFAEDEFESLLAETYVDDFQLAETDKERNQEPVIEDQKVRPENNWSPESVHDDRYLEIEEVLENTWLDDLQDSSDDEPLDPIDDPGDLRG